MALTKEGAWLAEQRRKLKLGKLTEQQFKLLNEIGMIFKSFLHFVKEYNGRKLTTNEEHQIHFPQ